MIKNKSIYGLLAVLSYTLVAESQTEKPPTPSYLVEIAERGQALTEYDAVAWHATDAVQPLNPPKGMFQRYLARKIDKGWVVAFGRFDENKTKFLIVYEAVQDSSDLKQFKVLQHDPPIEDTGAYFYAAKAHELASNEFVNAIKPLRPYNISILPASGGWYVYAIPAQTDFAVLPYGGDFRYLVSPDGSKIMETRQMHKTVLEEKVSKEPTSFSFHTHILSDIPEDSDLFYAHTRNANQEWIATKKYLYRIQQGGLNYLGRTDEILKLIQAGKYETLPVTQSSIVPYLQRLLE